MLALNVFESGDGYAFEVRVDGNPAHHQAFDPDLPGEISMSEARAHEAGQQLISRLMAG